MDINSEAVVAGMVRLAAWGEDLPSKVPSDNPKYQFGPFELDAAEGTLARNGSRVKLQDLPCRLLIMLVERPGEVVSRDEIRQRIWSADTFLEFDNSLGVAIRKVRDALGDDRETPRYLETVPRRGYRFSAPVTTLNGPKSRNSSLDSVSSAREETRGASRNNRKKIVIGAVILLVTAAIGFPLYRFVWHKKALPPPYQSIRMTRLTNTGKSRMASISPDGKYVVHVIEDSGNQSLWVRQVATANNVQIVAPAEVQYFGMTFSPDGNYIYYVAARKNESKAVAYQVPVLGGTPQKVMEDVDGPIAVSSDGSQMAYLRFFPAKGEDDLLVAKVDGSAEHVVDRSKLPDRYCYSWFEQSCGAGWSPDGKHIVVMTAQGTLGINTTWGLLDVPLQGPEKKVIVPPRWASSGRAAWVSDGSGVILDSADPSSGQSPQLWYVSFPEGSVRQITRDLNRYFGVSLTADSSALVTVQSEVSSLIWTASLAARSERQLTYGQGTSDGHDGIAFTPGGSVIYTSNINGHLDLWRVEAYGSTPVQLTFNAGNNFSPRVTPDGQTIVFTSNRDGQSNIWKMKINGSEQSQLTHGGMDRFPEVAPDGKWVFYGSAISGRFSVWKIPLSGGTPAKVNNGIWANATPSPDGKLLAITSFEEKSGWGESVVPVEGGEPVKVAQLNATRLQWTPDSKSIVYIDSKSGVSNLWSQELKGEAPRQITNFTSGLIFDFAISQDGKELILARGSVNSDVILINNVP
jgi:Tol biopolymer transport system component/DNA-binding winged helix-turn-helix (wHTH) protein